MSVDIGQEVTVIIPSKSFCSLARRAVARIRAQYAEVRVLVIVDATSAEEEGDDHTLVLVSPSRLLGAKRNFGVSHTDTPYLAFIDSDAYPDQGWLECGVAQLKADSAIGIVGGPNILDPDSDEEEYLSWLSCQSYLVSGGSVHEKIRSPSRLVDRLPSCNMIMPKELYVELGGFSTEVITGEDIELCIKVVESDHKILFSEDVVVFHKTRSLKGFLLQRYVWGKSTFDVLKQTYPHYLSSILPFLFVAGLVSLALLGAFHPSFWQLLEAICAAYFAAVLVESWRVGGTLSEKAKLVPYVLIGNLAPGVGAVVAFVVGDSIRSYRYYRNDD